MDEYLGRKSIVTTEMKLDSNGFWNVVLKMELSRSKDLVEWENVDTSCLVIDTSLTKALNSANFTMENYLLTLGEDIFMGLFEDKAAIGKDEPASDNKAS